MITYLPSKIIVTIHPCVILAVDWRESSAVEDKRMVTIQVTMHDSWIPVVPLPE